LAYAALLVASYLLGLFNLQIFFRILTIAGDGLDTAMSRIRPGRFRSFVAWIDENFHIFDLHTVRDEIARHYKAQSQSSDGAWDAPYLDDRMLILDPRVLTKEVLEIEGDMNLYAGMFLPLCLLGIYFLRFSWAAGLLAFAMAIFFAIRFAHLRHYDIWFVATAAKSMRAKPDAKSVPQDRRP
jgi:hypothetical protein